MDNATPERFGYWLNKQLKRVREDKTQEPLVFVNAWNEWAEGAYLEPDKTFGSGFLEAIKDQMSTDSSSSMQSDS